MLDKLSPEARHLMLLLIGAGIAWASTELPTRPGPARGIAARRTHHCGARVAHPDHSTVRDRRTQTP
jgi:hypothetical protein